MNNDFEKYRPLLMGLLDDELTAEEATEVHDALVRSAELREEYELLRMSSGKLEALSFLEIQDKVARRLWASPSYALMHNGGIWMVIGGYVVLILYSLYQMITDEGPMIPRFATAAIIIGAFILLFAIIWDRIEKSKTDPYKEVER